MGKCSVRHLKAASYLREQRASLVACIVLLFLILYMSSQRSGAAFISHLLKPILALPGWQSKATVESVAHCELSPHVQKGGIFFLGSTERAGYPKKWPATVLLLSCLFKVSPSPPQYSIIGYKAVAVKQLCGSLCRRDKKVSGEVKQPEAARRE